MSILSWLIEATRDYRDGRYVARYGRDVAALRVHDRLKPVEILNPQLGIFRFDSIKGAFSGYGVWNGVQVKIDLQTRAADVVLGSEYARLAELFWQDAPEWLNRSRECAERDLRATINNEFVKYGEEPQTKQQFFENLIPFWIGVDDLEAFSLLFDGDPFGDLPILVLGTFAEGPIEARI